MCKYDIKNRKIKKYTKQQLYYKTLEKKCWRDDYNYR